MLDYLMLFAQTAEATDANPTVELKSLALMSALGLIALMLSYLVTWLLFYEHCELDEALVRSGASGASGVRVVFHVEDGKCVNKGLFCFPAIHKLQRVSLRTVKIVVQAGSDKWGQSSHDLDGDQKSLATTQQQESIFQIGTLQDRELLPVLLEAEIYFHIPGREDYIINAARTFGEELDHQLPRHQAFIAGKVHSAIHRVVATMTLDELHSERLRFTDQVFCAAEFEDLRENGLELESMILEHVEQGAL